MRLRHPWLSTVATLILLAGLSASMILLVSHAASSQDREPHHPYIALDPPLVVNLANARRAQYLQIAAELQVESPLDAAAVEAHMPVIRDTLIVFFSGRDPEELRPVEKREVLRAEALGAIRHALATHAGRPAVDALYFTGFLIQ
jgi:flagellar protein FliL